MSDLQVITGLAILITGYTSLPCGLSDYHWQILVYLAWFSSITHLAAITFLRRYLYLHQNQRFVRVIWMSIFLLMLIVAIVPTGDFTTITGYEFAICSFGRRPEDRSSVAYQSMVFSILLLSFSFITRLIRLHKMSSDWANVYIREFVGMQYRVRVLKPISRWADTNTNRQHWKKTLVYRPFLSFYLVMRLVLDLFASMLSEVLC